jgi:hypothetical protein
MRFKLTEVTPQRLYEAGKRRLCEIPHTLAWNSSGGLALANRTKIEHFYNLYKGQRCFIIANGPSLKKMELSPLRDEITIGMNRIYLLFEEWGFHTTYLACINELVLEQFNNDISKLDIPKFLNWNRRNYFRDDDEAIFLKLALGINDTFGHDLTKEIASGGTVTYACLQLAYYMGFEEVILIGLDHNFVEKGRPNKTEVRASEKDESHCHPNYFPKGIKWQLPDLLRSEQAYSLARSAFEKDGRKVLDATKDGKCEVFEKIEFDSLFNGNRNA